MRWGPCPDLTAMTANVTQFGGAEGTWDGGAGAFHATLPGGSACTANGNAFARAEVTLLVNGCGTLRVTVEGIGERFVTDRTTAVVSLNGFEFLRSGSEGGGLTDCSTSALQLRTDDSPVEVPVQCGDELILTYTSLNTQWHPEMHCDFTVELP